MNRRTKAPNSNDDGTSGVQFGALTATINDKPRGRPTRTDSLRQQLERGEARWLKVALPVELARAVHVAAAASDSSPSEIVANLVRQHLVEARVDAG
jgi:hypothetical protein